VKKNNLIDLTILGFIFLFLFSFFTPSMLFSLTTTTGGDTCSHYPTAVYLKEVFLPQGRIMGWDMGSYAGFPVFYHYFPLTFVLMALLNFIIPMQISFKLISVLGTFLLPVCVYFSFKLLKYKFPIPVIAAAFSLAFLFMEANSMWGGNIPSTLAGEYSYSLGLALIVLFFGTLYDGIENKNKIILNALLVAALAFCHGYTFIFSGVLGLFFLFVRKGWWDNFKYLFKVYGLAGLLISFWFIPFFFNIPWVTSYVTRWYIESIFKVIPLILIPFLLLSIAALFLNLFERRSHYFVYAIFSSLVLYFIAPNIGMLDIRWIPFVQLFMVIFSATVLNVFLDEVEFPQMLPLIVYLMVILWIAPNVTFIKGWIKWNYEGFEGKKSWPLFQQINGYLEKTGPGRVVYEHSPDHNQFGSERAFENLPYFAHRDTLEGLYMQSSISSPFVFYIQSAVSKVCSGPFPQYKYTNLNLPAAISLLEKFNVTHYIVKSEQAKKQAKEVLQLRLEKQFGDYEIYRLTSNDGSYVTAVDYEPVLFETQDWKMDFFNWFRMGRALGVPLVYIKDPDSQTEKKFKLKASQLFDIPQVPLKQPKPEIKEKMGKEDIEFTTNLVGYPHLIKVSYHPNWQVEGADKIYLVAPSFMLVYPNQNKVRLYFGKTVYNYIGGTLSLAGLTMVLFSGIIFLINARKK